MNGIAVAVLSKLQRHLRSTAVAVLSAQFSLTLAPRTAPAVAVISIMSAVTTTPAVVGMSKPL